MTEEIKEYILSSYKEFNTNDVKDSTDYHYMDIVDAVKEMEKDGLVKWGKDKRKFIILESSNNKNSDTQKIKNIDDKNKQKNTEIVTRDFEKKKNQLKKFSQSLPTPPDIVAVRGGNHWYGPSVKATGDDLNDITQKMLHSFSEQNQNIVSIYKEFKTVYNTFNALDKDYIQRILVNLSAAEEANKKAVYGLEENKKIIESQKTVIEVLKKHKNELDEIKHLSEIDNIYDTYTSFKLNQEKINKELITSQNLTENTLTSLKNECNNFYQNHYNNISDYKYFQEKIYSQIKFLKLFVTILAVLFIALVILIISGVL